MGGNLLVRVVVFGNSWLPHSPEVFTTGVANLMTVAILGQLCLRRALGEVAEGAAARSGVRGKERRE